jgi:methionine-gamma-lyase
MRLVDLQAVCALARAHGAWSVIDNTYATPVITRPIALGADFVVHSATKYLGGHGDLVAGMVLGRAADIQQIRLFGVKDMTGAVLSPFNAMLILRGLKTLELRVQRHAASAQAIAERLQAHPAVHAVHYPGLESFPQHDLAQRQMALPGGMIAFRVRGGYEAGKRVMNRLTLIQRAVSLGDAETLIQHPASMTHSTYPVEQLIAHGIMPDLVRLSVGLEDVRDIWADLGAALDAERDTLSHAA